MELEGAEIAVEDRAAELIAFFGGMTEEETAAAIGVADRPVRRDGLKAKGWLHEAQPAAE